MRKYGSFQSGAKYGIYRYEQPPLVIEKNNLHDLDTWIFFKWIFKTFVAVLLVTNTWNIVMGVFDITQSVVNDSAGVIISDTSIDIATVITDIEAKLDAMSVGGLLGLALLVGMVLFVVNEANRVENQVIMQMVFIDVSCQNKLILAA